MTLTEGDRTPPRPALTGSRVRELAGSRLAAPATALLLVAASTAMVELVTPTVPYDAGGVIYLVGVLGGRRLRPAAVETGVYVAL
jgi:hypothetical protein